MNTQRQRSGKETLSAENLGAEEILRHEEVKRILDAVAIDAVDWVVADAYGDTQFMNALNHIIWLFLRQKLDLAFDARQRDELRKMRSYLEDYRKAVRNLKHSASLPPNLPNGWYEKAMEIYDGLEAKFKLNPIDGRKQAITEWEFIGHCAALFSVVFGIKPTSTPPPKSSVRSRPQTGAFTKFLKAIDAECRARLISPGTAAFLLPEHLHAEIFLAAPGEYQLRSRIKNALKYEKHPSEGDSSVAEPQLYWIGYIKTIEDLYKNSPN